MRKEEKNGSKNGSRSESPSAKSASSTKSSKRGDSPHPGGRLTPKDSTDKKKKLSRSASEEKSSSGEGSPRNRLSLRAEQERKKSTAKVASGTVGKNQFTDLPKLADAPDAEKEELSRRKLKLCAKIYDFNVDSQLQEKDGKRQTLFELVEFLNSASTNLGEPFMKDSVEMLGANLFRALIVKERSPLDIVDPEEDDPYLDKQWPHLEIVYEFLLVFCSTKDTVIDAKVAAKSLNQVFVSKLLVLFDTDDVRERDYLKMILQRIYSKFVSLRTGIRRAIQNTLLKVAYENEMQNGVGELLEIMQNIISSFKVPLKSEHRDLLHRVLLPLHKVRSLPFFHPNLMGCMTLYCDKEPRLISEIVSALLNLWPNSMATKQVLFLDEIEDLMNTKKSLDFQKTQTFLVKRLAGCMTSPHSQVAERALGFWKNDHMAKLFNLNRKHVYPIAIRALFKNVKMHWHTSVHGRTFEVLRIMAETDHDLFDECSAENRKIQNEEDAKDERRNIRWKKLEELFEQKGGAEAAAQAGKAHRIAKLPNGYACNLLCRRGVIALAKGKYGVGVSYGRGKAPAELQLQALVVNDDGKIIDAVHDYRPKALQGALYSSTERTVEALYKEFTGDECDDELMSYTDLPGSGSPSTTTSPTTSPRSRDASPKGGPRKDFGMTAKPPAMMWVHLARIPANVRMVIFVIAAYHRGQMKDTVAPTMSIVDDLEQKFIAQYKLNTTNSNVGSVAILKRAGSSWSFIRVEEQAKVGRHFMDMIEPTVGNVVRNYVPGAPKRQKVQVPLSHGCISIMPSAFTTKWLFVGMGWDLAPQAPDGVDMEVGCILIDNEFNDVLDAVRWMAVTVVSSPDSQEKVGIRHGGTGMLSAGMTLDLDAIPQKVTQILFGAAVRSDDQTLSLVQNPHCRVIDRGSMELARYDVKERSYKRGMLMARLFREPNKKRWSFQAIGKFCDVTSLQDLAEEYANIIQMTGKQLQGHVEDEFQTWAKEYRNTRPKRNIVSL